MIHHDTTSSTGTAVRQTAVKIAAAAVIAGLLIIATAGQLASMDHRPETGCSPLAGEGAGC